MDCARGLRQRTAERNAFTLVELMIVVAVVGLLAAMTVGSMVKARKQAQGRRIVNDMRELDGAISQWAMDANKKDGDSIDWNAVATYLKKPIVFSDILGNPYSWSTVGSNQIGLSWNTKAELAGVGIDWGPY
jgi:prepilin-type N-terminal cleavage/methylation domain-containing protein